MRVFDFHLAAADAQTAAVAGNPLGPGFTMLPVASQLNVRTLSVFGVFHVQLSETSVSHNRDQRVLSQEAKSLRLAGCLSWLDFASLFLRVIGPSVGAVAVCEVAYS